MPPLQAKQHKIQNLRQFLNGNVPIAPIPTQRICQELFLEIPLRVDKPSLQQYMIFPMWNFIKNILSQLNSLVALSKQYIVTLIH
jgi:hypothetical protein